MEQVEVLNKLYANLDYNNDKEKALREIHHLSETVRFHGSVRFPGRLETLANIIRENISHFRSVCRHVDIVNTILEYLINFAEKFRETSRDQVDYVQRNFKIFNIQLTLLNMCTESAIQSFFIYPIFTDFFADPHSDIKNIHSRIKHMLSSIPLEREMIILEDSDLNAVVNYLIITDNFSLHKIWVQEQVKEKFLWLMKRHYLDLFAIDTFQSLKDIQLRVCHEFTINMISIWSEDIVAAKNLALSLKGHVMFINTHMDFSGGIMILPYLEITGQSARSQSLNGIRQEKSDSTDIEESVNVIHFSRTAQMKFTSIYNLFYDGTWKEPVKGMYWKHNDNLWANATDDDIVRCYESAEKGLKTWSIKSIKTRIQILSKLVPILKLTGKFVLAAIVERWLKFPYLFDTIRGYTSQNGIETMEVRKPLGIIILKDKNENVLFFRLMQTLIAGNSVIVMFDANFCNLTSYCDMFSTCEIPAGVINLLSHEDIDMLEYKLCSPKYTNYEKKIFSTHNSKKLKYIEPYKNLSICKYIIVHHM